MTMRKNLNPTRKTRMKRKSVAVINDLFGSRADTNQDTCDDGKTCLCGKPAAEHPDHPWVFTFAGQQKFLTSILQLNLRNPDCFGMYVYNDSYGWGTMEVVENILVDFQEAEGNWKEQWAMCEAIAMLWLRGAPGPLYM
jgi:hypothetical protein